MRRKRRYSLNRLRAAYGFRWEGGTSGCRTCQMYCSRVHQTFLSEIGRTVGTWLRKKSPPSYTTPIRSRSTDPSSTMASTAQPVTNATPLPVPSPAKKKQPYPFYLGGVAATIAASITHPLDLTKVRLQASGDKRMIESMKKTVRTAGFRGLYDGITGTWMRQMSYSLCRFWAYDESKKILGANPQSPPWTLAAAGVMGMSCATIHLFDISLTCPCSWLNCWCGR